MMSSVAVNDRWSIKQVAAMTGEQFELWQALLEERTGMTVSAERKSFLETSLSMRMRELDLDDYDEYYEYLVTGSTESRAMEWTILVDRLTVQETSFFRHPGAYSLAEDFVKRFVEHEHQDTTLDVWSVGCSTGEEPYSLAMLIEEQFRGRKPLERYGVTATDISMPTLSKARKGVYSRRKVEMIDAHLRERYFRELGDREMEVVPSLRDRICFARVNVLELDRAPMRDMDLIFCQNMLIYFRRWRKREIANRLAERLAPGGLLVFGPGEITEWRHLQLERVHCEDALAFQRRR
jgi:type IV pilus assembly protein PilK